MPKAATPARKALDLTLGVASLEGKKFDAIKNVVKRAQAANSTLLDLESVQASLDALISLGKNADKSVLSEIGLGLFTHAMIVYARASASSAERFSVGIEAAYSPEQKETHKRIIKLRDKCIAHFGEAGGTWNSEKLIYLERPGKQNAELTFVHNRTSVDFTLVIFLKDLLNSAIPLVKRRQSEAINKVDDEIRALDSSEASLLLSVPFDAKSFFNSKEELGDKFWEQESYSAPTTYDLFPSTKALPSAPSDNPPQPAKKSRERQQSRSDRGRRP